ncbi:MAG TPA: hypothetical protein DCR97_12280, partial [Deltaproteobacteria bacterium]|nr:hypothetical protein [Deltaproteobacteria bacterium]
MEKTEFCFLKIAINQKQNHQNLNFVGLRSNAIQEKEGCKTEEKRYVVTAAIVIVPTHTVSTSKATLNRLRPLTPVTI